MTHGSEAAEIGVFGGSGFYSLLDDVREIKVDTPYGPPSDSFFLAEVAGRRVAFLPRHGRRHTIPPHQINYRANVWAMRSLGVKAVISPCAAGSLQLAVKPGDFVVCDQFVDRTRGRNDTFFDGPIVTHLSSADDLRPGPARAWRSPRSATTASTSTSAARSWSSGAALLDQGRVEVVQRRRLGGHQHDPVPRGVAVPRARDGGRQHQPHHRLRRRRPSRAPRRSTPRPCSRCSQQNAERIQEVVLDLIGRFPADLDALGRGRGARARRGATVTRSRPRTSACSRRGCEAREPETACPIGVCLRTIRAEPGWWLESARRLDAAGYAGRLVRGTTSSAAAT